MSKLFSVCSSEIDESERGVYIRRVVRGVVRSVPTILCNISTLQVDSTQKYTMVKLYIRKNKHAKNKQCKKKRGKWHQ